MSTASAQKKAQRKRLLAKLGVESQTLLSICIASGGGYMKKSEYEMFWEQVDGPSEATWFLTEIAHHLTKQLESGAKGSSSGGGGGSGDTGALGTASSGPPADALLTTLNFLLLTQEVLTADKRVKEVLSAWAKIEGSKNIASQHPLFSPCKEVFRLLNLRCEHHDLIGSLIVNCASMYGSNKEFERMMDILNYSTIDDNVDLKGGESSFYYEHLKRLAHEGAAFPHTTTVGKTPITPAAAAAAAAATPQSMLQAILTTTFSKIVTLPQQMKMNPKYVETTFCALFHLIRNLMTLHAITDVNFLHSAINTLKPFYVWPQPYGRQTVELLTRLEDEMSLPGAFMRARLEQEVHTTPYFEIDPVTNVGEINSAIFYIYSQDDKLSQAYTSVLDLKPFKQQSLRRSPVFVKESDATPVLMTATTQALFVLNLLACHPQFGANVEADAAAIRLCNCDQVFAIYKRAQAMVREVKSRPTESGEIRVQGLQDIRQQIRQAASTSDQRDLVRLPEKLVAPFSPALPSISHLSIATPTSSAYQFDPRDQWRMIGHKVAPFVHVPIVEELVALFAMYRDSNRVTPLTLRLMLSGGDELLHQVVCAWCAIKQTKPEVLDGLKPMFYLLPFSRNHMAAFIARHDAWYHRHIYVPTRSNTFMAPWVRVDQNDMDAIGASAAAGPAAALSEEEGAELPPPGQFFRSTIESYAREAALTFEPYIYQLEGYLSAESEGLRPSASAKVPGIPGPDQLIPFLQRAEIGVLAAAAEWKRARRLPDSTRLEDIAAGSKGFEYTPIELVAKFTKMDLHGRISEVVTEDPTVYQSLLVSSVPRKGDATFTPNPTYENMELAARLHKTHNSAKSASLGRTHVLAFDPKQHVAEVEICAANPNQTFGILIDNQYFGPFYKIKLLPCLETYIEKNDALGVASTSGKRMKLPIQSFFPMDM